MEVLVDRTDGKQAFGVVRDGVPHASGGFGPRSGPRSLRVWNEEARVESEHGGTSHSARGRATGLDACGDAGHGHGGHDERHHRGSALEQSRDPAPRPQGNAYVARALQALPRARGGPLPEAPSPRIGCQKYRPVRDLTSPQRKGTAGRAGGRPGLPNPLMIRTGHGRPGLRPPASIRARGPGLPGALPLSLPQGAKNRREGRPTPARVPHDHGRRHCLSRPRRMRAQGPPSGRGAGPSPGGVLAPPR
jgi:hypothetical protein